MRTRGRPKHPDILTPRQWDVLALLRRGLTNEEIARELNISADGVKYHVSDILSRLGVESRHEAAEWQPTSTTSWLGILLAPALLVKKLKLGAVGYAAAAAAVGAAAIGVALLVWGVASTSNDRTRSTAVSTPRVARTGIPDVDRVIDLLVHQDVDGLVKVAEYGPINCTVTGTGGSGPPCASGQPEGSPVTVFPISQCEGSYVTNDDQLRAAFGLALQRQPSAAVYAVLRDNSEDRGRDSYWIAITQDRPSRATADVSFWNITTEGRIVTLVNECGPVGAAQQVAYRFPINPDFVVGPFNNCSAQGETPNFMITVDGFSPGTIKPQFWGEAKDTLGNDTGERAIVTVTDATKWYGDIPRLEDVRTGNVLEAVGRRQPDCTILAETILSPLPPRLYRNDALDIELPYPADWSYSAAAMPYSTCSACTVVGPKDLQYPYGIEIFTQPGGVCPLVCYGANNASERGVPAAVTVAGYHGGRNEFEHVPPLGVTNETGETTPFREVVTFVHVSDQDLVIIGFFRYGDAAGEARVRAAYDLMLETATAPKR